MVVLVDGVCIADNKGTILYWTSLLGDTKRSSLQSIVTEALNCCNKGVGQECPDGGYAAHISRGGCWWVLTTPCSTPSVGERLALVQALQWLQAAVQSSLLLPAGAGDGDTSAAAAEAVATNVTSVHQIVLELMSCGVLQVQPLPRILSQLSLQQRQQQTTATNSLFGVVRVPDALSQHIGGGTAQVETPAQHTSVCLDVVERVQGSGVVVRGGGVTNLNGVARGSVLVRTPHHLLNRALTLTFSKDIPDQPVQSGGLQMVCCGGRVSWDGRTARCSALHQPSACLLQYTLAPALPCSLHLQCAPLPHSNSDCEIVASVQGTLPRSVSVPHITLRLELPHSTVTTTTRHTGHPHQTLAFSAATASSSTGHQDQRQSDDKEIVPSLTWTLKNFPGDGEAKAFIRVVGCGRDSSLSRATLDFEVSQWLCSQLKVMRLTTTPALPSPAWVRYLTIGERIALTLPPAS